MRTTAGALASLKLSLLIYRMGLIHAWHGDGVRNPGLMLGGENMLNGPKLVPLLLVLQTESRAGFRNT